jgi:hypothetical protein
MSLTTEQMAELLAGIVRSQQAIIDAIESDSGGWRNNHLLNKLNVAANTRSATPRLIDVPSRVLLRSQSRVPMDVEAIMAELQSAMSNVAVATTPAPPPGKYANNPVNAPAKPAVRAATAAVAATAAAAGVATTAAVAPASTTKPDDDEFNFFDS